MSKILINDFKLFYESMKSIARLVDAAKISINTTGLEIYAAKGSVARCELSTNAVCAKDEQIEFCIDKLSSFNHVLATVNELHNDDFLELDMSYSRPNVLFKSKKIKLKYSTCNEAAIESWVSKKILAEMAPVFTFKTNSDFIKRVNGHSFLFSDPKSARVYIETKDDMESNAVFATLGNKAVDTGKEITLKFGLVTSGAVPDGKSIIIDLERMNMLNCASSNDIDVSMMDKNILVSTMKASGKNGSYFNIKIYTSLMKG